VLQDDSQLKMMSRLFATIDEQVKAGVKRGEKLDQIRKAINLDSFRETLAGNSRMKKIIFRSYVVGPAVEAAYLDATTTQ